MAIFRLRIDNDIRVRECAPSGDQPSSCFTLFPHLCYDEEAGAQLLYGSKVRANPYDPDDTSHPELRLEEWAREFA